MKRIFQGYVFAGLVLSSLALGDFGWGRAARPDAGPGRCTDAPGRGDNPGFGHRSGRAVDRWLDVPPGLSIAGGPGRPRAAGSASGQGTAVGRIPYPRSASSFPRGNQSQRAGVGASPQAAMRRPRALLPAASLMPVACGLVPDAVPRRLRGRRSPDRLRRAERASPRRRAAGRVLLPGTVPRCRRYPAPGLRPANPELPGAGTRKDRRPGGAGAGRGRCPRDGSGDGGGPIRGRGRDGCDASFALDPDRPGATG